MSNSLVGIVSLVLELGVATSLSLLTVAQKARWLHSSRIIAGSSGVDLYILFFLYYIFVFGVFNYTISFNPFINGISF